MTQRIIDTAGFTLPDKLAAGIVGKVQDTSFLARLATTNPQIQHGKTDFITFSEYPKAEFVGESAEKSPSIATFKPVTSQTHKIQVTVRLSDEVLYADDEYQVGALNAVTDALNVAISRAIDLGAVHAINPLTGATVASITDALATTTNSVTKSGSVETDLDAAMALLVANDYVPTAIALDPKYAFTMRAEKYTDGRRKYPDVPMNIRDLGNVEGLNCAVSNTVSAPEATAATNVCGIMGQFDRFNWGMVDQIPIETIQFGDPDGQGDLKHYNQIALRAEAYVGWVCFDLKAFAKIVTAAA